MILDHIRLFFLLLKYKFKSSVKSTKVVIPFRTWLTDLDTQIHMNNARYFTYFEWSRWVFTMQSGFLKLYRQGIMPVIVHTEANYRKSLRPFQKFEVTAEMVKVEGRKVVFHHKATSRGDVYADGLVILVMIKKGKVLEHDEIVEIFNAAELAVEIVPPIQTDE